MNGNVSTCTTQVTVTAAGSRPAASEPFTVTAAPNPSSHYFTLKFNSISNENMVITVFDATKRIIEQRHVIPANSSLQMGDSYFPGIYLVEITQGKEKKVLRLIKAGN